MVKITKDACDFVVYKLCNFNFGHFLGKNLELFIPTLKKANRKFYDSQNKVPTLTKTPTNPKNDDLH
jgi:hypothetical protein